MNNTTSNGPGYALINDFSDVGPPSTQQGGQVSQQFVQQFIRSRPWNSRCQFTDLMGGLHGMTLSNSRRDKKKFYSLPPSAPIAVTHSPLSAAT